MARALDPTILSVAMSETTIRKAIQDALEASYPDGVWWRQQAGVLTKGRRHIRMGRTGLPDICGVVRGRFVGVEVKTRTGKASPGQLDAAQRLRRAGGHWLLARSVGEALWGVSEILAGKWQVGVE